MALRKAGITDKELTFKWATNEDIRAFSFSTNVITWDEHSKWFEKRIHLKECYFYVAELEGAPVGSIRFDVENAIATISYLVDSGHHGVGIGRILLASGMKIFLGEAKEVNQIVGYVRKNNIPSVKIFERMGFSKSENDTPHADAIKYFKKIET
jgi:RimJ/RimL family protein N-acetyltransferase